MELLEKLELRIDENKEWTTSEERQLLLLLDEALGKCINRLYPLDDSKTELPKKYENVQLDLALYMYNLRGAEGETSHSENGIGRSFISEEEILRVIKPYAKVV